MEIIDSLGREQAPLHICYHTKLTLNASPSTEQTVSNEYHRRECLITHSHDPGSDNFNRAEEVEIILPIGTF